MLSIWLSAKSLGPFLNSSLQLNVLCQTVETFLVCYMIVQLQCSNIFFPNYVLNFLLMGNFDIWETCYIFFKNRCATRTKPWRWHINSNFEYMTRYGQLKQKLWLVSHTIILSEHPWEKKLVTRHWTKFPNYSVNYLYIVSLFSRGNILRIIKKILA